MEGVVDIVINSVGKNAVTFRQCFQRVCESNPDKPFIVTATETLSYAQFWAECQAVSAIISCDYEVSRIGISMSEPVSFLRVFFACLLCGKHPYLLNYRLPNLVEELCDIYGLESCLTSCPDFGEVSSYSDMNTQVESVFSLFTSGSSGIPKCVRHLDRTFLSHAMASCPVLGFSQDSSWNLCLPLFHVSGLSSVFRALHVGGSLVLDGPATHVSFVQSQFQSYLGEVDRPDYKCILLGGSSLSEQCLKDGLSQGLPVSVCYGCTETASHIGLSSVTATNLQGSVRVFEDVSVYLNSDGCVCIASPALLLGYESPDGELRSGLDNQGYFVTQDLGEYCDGKLRIRGRRDLMFVSQGENVFPDYLERLILDCLPVDAVTIVPVPDKDKGYVGAAFVSSSLALEDIREKITDLIGDKLSALFVPTYFYPLSIEDGKVSRYDLKSRL